MLQLADDTPPLDDPEVARSPAETGLSDTQERDAREDEEKRAGGVFLLLFSGRLHGCTANGVSAHFRGSLFASATLVSALNIVFTNRSH